MGKSLKRVGIVARGAYSLQGGVCVHARNLISYLPVVDSSREYFVYTDALPKDGKLDSRLRKIRFCVLPGTPHALWRTLLQVFTRWHRVEALLYLASNMPLRHGPRPAVSVIHDTAFLDFPTYFEEDMRHSLVHAVGASVARSDALIAVSQATRRDVVRHYGVSSGNIHVVYHGYDRAFFRANYSKTEVEDTLAQFGISSPYFLFVGTLQPRKNINQLIEVVTQLKSKHGSDAPDLVLVGQKGWQFQGILSAIERAAACGCVRYLRFVSTADLARLMAGAVALILTSFYEGFGLPLLESMACGTPVITSNTSSLPEVVGNAGLLVDPYSPEKLGQTLWKIASDQELRQHMREKSLARAQGFSWENAATATLDILDRAFMDTRYQGC